MERRTGLVTLKLTQAAELAAAAMPGARVLACAMLPGGRSNTTYRLHLDDGRRVVLRLYTRDEGGCAKEIALARMLGSEMPVAAPLGHCGPGVADVPHPAALFEYRRGTLLSAITPGNAVGLSIGRVLARIRAHTFLLPGDLRAPPLHVEPWEFGDDPAQGFVRWCIHETRAGERLGLVLSKRLLDFAAVCSQRWPEMRHEARLVHGDFNPTNILVDGDEVTAIVDWEWAHSGNPLGDLANLLRARDEFPLPQAFIDGVLQGLADGGVRMPHDWREQANWLDLLSACEFLTSTADRPQIHARAMAQIRQALA
jgi:aminoglycoside phosphotransferase (APT) family kinase protein